MCQNFAHSLLYLYLPVRIQFRICAFGHLNSFTGVRYFHACRSKPYTLSAETLYPFVGEIVTGRRSTSTLQTVSRAYPGQVCPFFIASSAISVFGSMWKTYGWMVCVRVKMSLGILGSESLKAQ